MLSTKNIWSEYYLEWGNKTMNFEKELLRKIAIRDNALIKIEGNLRQSDTVNENIFYGSGFEYITKCLEEAERSMEIDAAFDEPPAVYFWGKVKRRIKKLLRSMINKILYWYLYPYYCRMNSYNRNITALLHTMEDTMRQQEKLINELQQKYSELPGGR